MLYAILAIIVLAALFLLFRDDHDPSYNKDEKSPRKAEKAPASPSLKEQILGEIKVILPSNEEFVREKIEKELDL